MIELKNLSCGYVRKVVLSEVNLTIEPGKLTCLLGRNGAGKSTLFKTILGLLPPLGGEVLIQGKPLAKILDKERAQNISYVPQTQSTPFPFTVFEVVLMGQFAYSSRIFKLPGEANRKVAMECIGLMGIGHLKRKPYTTLSGGEKQLVLIARAMAQKPRFIAMDEPTSNLDLGNQVRVMKIAQVLKEQGYGVIMNTHDPDHALNYADNVVLLKDGKMKASGSPAKVLPAETISEVYDTPVELFEATCTDGKLRSVCMAI